MGGYNKIEMPVNEKIIFIVGRSRSGTTLLAKMLNAHPHISIPPEGIFLYSYYEKYKNKRKWNKKDLKVLSEEILEESKMVMWNITKQEVLNTLEQSKTNYYPEMCVNIYRLWSKKNEKVNPSIIGDQNPYYLLFIPKLLKIFPNSKFIFITRDYRDNILSLKNVQFDLNKTSALAYRYKFFNKKGKAYLLKFPDSICHVRYEDLVRFPNNTLQKISDFLEITYDDDMLYFYSDTKQETRDWHKNLNQPLLISKVEKWKKEMSTIDLEISDFIAGKIGQEFNYKPISKLKQIKLLRFIVGYLMGIIYTRIEKGIFLLPVSFRNKIINLKRRNLKY